MFQQDIKDKVLKHIEYLVAQVTKENPSVKLAPFPMFYIPSVEEYIWNSLGGVFALRGKEAANTIATLLANIYIMQRLSDKDAYNLYQELVKLATEADETFTNAYFEVHPEHKKQITCKRGCSWCCYQEVQLNGLEAKHLWKIVPRTKAFEAQKKAATFGKHDPEQTGSAQGPYVRRLGLQNARCPFLSDQNDCSIYETRPLVCKYYEVYSDVAGCHPHTLNDTQTMRLPVFAAVLEAAMFEAYGFTTLQMDGTIVKLERQ